MSVEEKNDSMLNIGHVKKLDETERKVCKNKYRRQYCDCCQTPRFPYRISVAPLSKQQMKKKLFGTRNNLSLDYSLDNILWVWIVFPTFETIFLKLDANDDWMFETSVATLSTKVSFVFNFLLGTYIYVKQLQVTLHREAARSHFSYLDPLHSQGLGIVIFVLASCVLELQACEGTPLYTVLV